MYYQVPRTKYTVLQCQTGMHARRGQISTSQKQQDTASIAILLNLPVKNHVCRGISLISCMTHGISTPMPLHSVHICIRGAVHSFADLFLHRALQIWKKVGCATKAPAPYNAKHKAEAGIHAQSCLQPTKRCKCCAMMTINHHEQHLPSTSHACSRLSNFSACSLHTWQAEISLLRADCCKLKSYVSEPSRCSPGESIAIARSLMATNKSIALSWVSAHNVRI